MASRRGDTFDKRQRERRRQDKAAQKRAKRQGLEAPGPMVSKGPPIASASSAEEGELMEMFALLSQHHAAGGIDDATFAARRREIFGKLGLDIPMDGLGVEADEEADDEDDDAAGEAADAGDEATDGDEAVA